MVASSKFSLFPIDPMKTEASKGETECMFSSSRSRDLLLRFSGRFSPDEGEEANGSDSEEIELGLSLGGCFNSANNHKNRILRTSSIPAILPCEALPLFPLFRSCSLPEEEIQSIVRMETKRKRQLEEGSVLKSKRFEAKNEGSWVRGGGPANGVSSPVASRWIARAGQPSTLVKGITPASQASAASEGSNSSAGSELENRAGQGFELLGFSHASEFRSPSRFTTISEPNYHKSHPFSPFSVTPISKPTINGIAIGNGIVSNETLLRNNNGERCSNGSGELSKSMMKEMPLVSTKGDGLNGKRIEGFLYKYGRGEEVRIVCVCHGSFLTPAEFVKHAGGGDVAHPLRHIVVNPSPAALL